MAEPCILWVKGLGPMIWKDDRKMSLIEAIGHFPFLNVFDVFG